MSEIRYIQQQHIDKTKWDECICSSVNGIIYGYSWYLDMVNPGWDGLVLNDYEAVMPLTIRSKFFMKYLCIPDFTQQLGVFYRHPSTKFDATPFLEAIPKKFRLIDIKINSGNTVAPCTFVLKENSNYILSLNQTYANLFKNFSSHHKREITVSQKKHLTLSHTITVEDACSCIIHTLTGKIKNMAHGSKLTLMNITDECLKRACANVYGVYHSQGDLVAAAIFVYSNQRWVFLAAASTEQGRKQEAMYFLLNEFIQIHAESDAILDFEGSNIEGLAYFYSGFNATRTSYLSCYKNSLPPIIRSFKK